MRTLIPSALLLSALLSAPAGAATPEFAGRWRVLEPVAATRDVTWLELSREDGQLVGTLTNASGSQPVAGAVGASGRAELQVADGRLITLQPQGAGLRGSVRAPGATGADLRAVRVETAPVTVAPVTVAER